MGTPIDAYKPDAFKVTHFKLIREKEDLDRDESFNPELTHQIFGESEVIFGYKDLSVTIACMAGSLKTYVNVKYSETIPQSLADGVQPDDIFKSLEEIYPAGFITDRSEFLNEFEEELKFKPFGSLEKSYTIESGDNCRNFGVYYVDVHSLNYSEFKKYLHRMEPFLLFFIDEASYLDLDDRWCFYVIYEIFKSQSSQNDRYAFAGYASVCKFYAYPEHIRPRISQLLILPPFQKMGHATRLLEIIYDQVISLPKVIDITFEAPSEDLSRLRNYLDSKRCLQLPDVLPILKEAQELSRISQDCESSDNGEPPSKIRRLNGNLMKPTHHTLMKKFSELVRPRLKLSRSQCHRVFSILVYFLLARTDPDALDGFYKTILNRTRLENKRWELSYLLESLFKRSRHTASALMTAEKSATFDEQYERELEEQVKTEFSAYKRVAEKLESAIEAGELEILALPEAC